MRVGANGVTVGARLEVCPQALALAEELTDRVRRHGGAALLIDYGYGSAGDGRGEVAHTDTLRGIKEHEFLHPLLEPGRLDLSADVDFAASICATKTESMNIRL